MIHCAHKYEAWALFSSASSGRSCPMPPRHQPPVSAPRFVRTSWLPAPNLTTRIKIFCTWLIYHLKVDNIVQIFFRGVQSDLSICQNIFRIQNHQKHKKPTINSGQIFFAQCPNIFWWYCWWHPRQFRRWHVSGCRPTWWWRRSNRRSRLVLQID